MSDEIPPPVFAFSPDFSESCERIQSKGGYLGSTAAS